MKRTTFLTLLALISGLVAVQSQGPVADGTSVRNLTFEVESFKQTYLPYEPMSFIFRVTNRTAAPIETPHFKFLEQAKLVITDPRSKTQEISSLSLSTGGGPQLPGGAMVLKPNENYEQELIPSINPKYFGRPGLYNLKFVLGELESNTVDLVIDEPRGPDREAFDFLKERGKDVAFSETYFDGSGAKPLKIFVERFGSSAYGQFAIQALARYYMHNGELDKARLEFEKIKHSPLKPLREQTRIDLAEINKKKSELVKPEGPGM